MAGIKYLCLNTLRTFKDKKLQACAIGIIILLSSFLYTMMSYALESLTKGVDLLIEETNQEDFSIMMIDGLLSEEVGYIPASKQEHYGTYPLSELKRIDYEVYEGIMGARKRAFQKIYPQYNLELRSYKDVDYRHHEESHTLRIFKPADEINVTYVEEGRLPEAKNEIALNKIYGDKNNLEIGDTLTINQESYIITGWILLSDMNFLLLGDDLILDNKKIGIAVVNDRGYEQVDDKEFSYYAGKAYSNKELGQSQESMIDEKDFKEEVIDTFKDHGSLDFIVDIVATKNQIRSGGIVEELKSSQAATLGICIFISGIAVMLVGILIGKLLKNERVQIGVLKALGYRSAEIAISYTLLLLAIAVPMVYLGYVFGKMSAVPLKNFFLDFYVLLDLPIEDSFEVLMTAVVFPIVLIVGISFYMIWRMLSKPTLQLMKVGEDEKIPILFKFVSKYMKRLSVQTKFKYTFIYKNTSKFIVFFWGITFSSMLILMSLMMSNFFEKMTLDQYNRVSYIYDGVIDPIKAIPKVASNQEKYLIAGSVFYEDEIISIHGLEPNNQLYKLYNHKNEDITMKLENGVIVNESFVIMYDVAIGDLITVEIGEEVYTLEIAAVSSNYGGETIYMTRSALSKMVTDGKTERLFSGVYSTEPLNEKMYLAVTNKYDMIEQTELMQGLIKVSIYSMMGSAVFISAIILYVLTTMTVEDNYYNISLLKVMGYNKKEVNSMILNSYLIYAVITYLVSIPITQISVDIMVDYMSQSFGMVMPLNLTRTHMVIGFMVVISIFQLGTLSAKKRIQKVSLQEVLKAYRE